MHKFPLPQADSVPVAALHVHSYDDARLFTIDAGIWHRRWAVRAAQLRTNASWDAVVGKHSSLRWRRTRKTSCAGRKRGLV